VHRLGIQHAESRPQVSGHINSERQLFGHFKSSNNQGDRDREEVRGLNRQESNVYDLEVSLRHTLWDWHVTDNRVKAHQIAYDVERLRLNLSLSEQVLSLLKAAMRLVDVLRQEVESLNRSIDERQAAARIARDQAAIFKEEYSMIKPLVDAGHEPRIKLIEAEKRLQESEGAAELAVLAINAMRSDLTTKQKQIVSVRQNYQADAGTQLIEAQTRLSQALARKDALAGRVGYAEVKAPHTGTISALHLKTVGVVVQPGTVLAQIVPEEKAVTIRANLKPENVADVYVGQIAPISLSAYDVSRYGSLEGVVKHIASNTTEREGQPPFYETIITVPDPIFPKIGLTPDIVPGMTVVVDIIGGKRTVLDYILTPLDRATRVAFREN